MVAPNVQWIAVAMSMTLDDGNNGDCGDLLWGPGVYRREGTVSSGLVCDGRCR